VIVCRQCGERAREGVEFCESCGAFLEWEGERVDQAGRAPAAPPAGPAPPSGPPVPEPAPSSGPPPSPPPAAASSAPAPAAPAAPAPTPPVPEGPQPPPAAGGREAGGTVRCLECGAVQAAERRFCKRCGGALDLVAVVGPAEAPAAPATPPAPAGPAAPGPPGPPAVPGTSVARAPSSPVPDPPRITGRAAAAEPSRGLQPAEAPPRPPPVRPQAAPAAIEPGGDLCPQCGTANAPGRRFCRRCGAVLDPAAVGSEVVPAGEARPSLWRRMTGRGDRADRTRSAEAQDDDGSTAGRAARAAYRRSLDVRYRVLRVFAVLAGVGLMAGAFGLVGLNPVSGARSLWDRFFPRYETIGELQAVAEPGEAVDADFPPGAAVDRDPATAWATPWEVDPAGDPPRACADEPGTGGAESALLVTLPERTAVGKLSIQPNLPGDDANRAAFGSPTRVELRFDDGSCEDVELKAEAGFQDHRIDGPETTTVRIAVLDAAPPRDPALSQGQVAIGEVRLYRQK
jgi:zinc-ribbon domain